MSKTHTLTATYHENTIATAFILPAAIREMWRFTSTDESRTNLVRFEAGADDMAPMTLSASTDDVSVTYVLMPVRL